MVQISDSFNITRPNFGTNPVTFLKEVRSELRKVAWPSRPEVLKLTAVVVGVSVLVGVYLGGLDFIFAKAMAAILSR